MQSVLKYGWYVCEYEYVVVKAFQRKTKKKYI